jgi:hypothetical protein
MAPIMAVGQAAGTAAALCCAGGSVPRRLDADALQEALRDQNQVLDIPPGN